MASCIQHDEQLPQSPTAEMTAAHDARAATTRRRWPREIRFLETKNVGDAIPGAHLLHMIKQLLTRFTII
jgi:hypothetical protein